MSATPRSDEARIHHEQATGPWSGDMPVYAFTENLSALVDALLECARSAKVDDTFESLKREGDRDYAVIQDCVHTQTLARDGMRTITERLGGTWRDRDSLLLAAAEAHKAIETRRAWADAQLA